MDRKHNDANMAKGKNKIPGKEIRAYVEKREKFIDGLRRVHKLIPRFKKLCFELSIRSRHCLLYP